MMRSEKSTTAALAISIAWLFYLFSYISRAEPCVLVNELINDFHITSATVGFIVSCVYLTYVPMQIPAGIIADKLGVKTVLVASSLICSLGAFIFGSGSSIFQLEIGRLLIGMASAPAFLCCGKVAAEYFDKKQVGMLMGVSMVMGCLGGIFGTSPVAFLSSHIGWRGATYVIASVGILTAILAFLCIKSSKPKETSSIKEQEHSIMDGIKTMAKNPKFWLLGFYGAMSYLPLSALAELWGVPFMELRFGVSTEKAAISSIVIFIGFGLGGVISAMVAEKINSYKKTIIIFTLGLSISFGLSFYSDMIGFNACLLLMFLGGTFAGANTLCFAIAFSLVPKKFIGTAGGFTNMLIMTSGIIFQPLLGKLLDFFRNGKVTPDGTPIYDIPMYRSAFMFVIVGMVAATIATFFINDLKHQEEK